MATSSILGGDRAASIPSGRDAKALGPSDSSDSGADVQGERGFDALLEGEVGGDRVDLHADSDAEGTGERGPAVHDTDILEGADIVPDRVDSVADGAVDARSDDELGLLADDHPDDLDDGDDVDAEEDASLGASEDDEV
jgi:hypothetical protein